MGIRHGPHDWNYKSTFIDRPDYTRVEKENSRGKVLGGSTCINYYTWLRGSAETLDEWKEYGGEDWAYENTKEYFNKPATYHDDENKFPKELASTGIDGPIHVAHPHPLPEIEDWRNALEKAWVSKGGETSVDVYNGKQHGLFRCVNTVYNGVRSNASLFVEGKSNVVVVSSSAARRIIFDGDVAVGAVAAGPDGEEYSFTAKREVIVSSGAYGSPQILMHSGIGIKSDLEALGISSFVDSPHVGQNLQDHPVMTQVFKLKDGYGLDTHIRYGGPEHDAAIASYQKDKSGPLSSALLELVAFPRIDERLMKYDSYRKAKEENGGKCPFGPEGQPHFEVDFLVSTTLNNANPSHSSLLLSNITSLRPLLATT
jgi:choline dehydrogenase